MPDPALPLSRRPGSGYGVGKPHIFWTKWGWCSYEVKGNVATNWIGCDFRTICSLLNTGTIDVI